MTSMANNALNQLVRTDLLPEELSKLILSGGAPDMTEVLYQIVIGIADAYEVQKYDKNSTWTDRRLSRQLVGVAFLVTLLLNGGTFGKVEPEATQ
jgi:hypothetical protein